MYLAVFLLHLHRILAVLLNGISTWQFYIFVEQYTFDTIVTGINLDNLSSHCHDHGFVIRAPYSFWVILICCIDLISWPFTAAWLRNIALVVITPAFLLVSISAGLMSCKLYLVLNVLFYFTVLLTYFFFPMSFFAKFTIDDGAMYTRSFCFKCINWGLIVVVLFCVNCSSYLDIRVASSKNKCLYVDVCCT